MKLALGPALKRHNVTQTALAEKIGVSKGFISEIVSGKKRPSVETLEKIAKALDADISVLYETGDPFAIQPSHDKNAGFSDARPAVFTGNNVRLNDLLTTFIGDDMRHPATYVATADMIGFAILSGDVLVLDMKSARDIDGLVIATTTDTITGATKTLVRRRAGSALIPPDPRGPIDYIDPESPAIGILGLIKGVIRGRMTGDYPIS